MSRRILLGGLAASAVGALLSACDGARSPTATAAIAATSTSAPSVKTATAQPSSAPLPTATPLAIVTPALPAATAVAELVTWTDPQKFVQLRFPRNWQTSVADRRPDNILELRAPDRRAGLYGTLVLWLDLHDPQRGTLDAEVQLIRDGLTAGTPYVASMQTITDLTVGRSRASPSPSRSLHLLQSRYSQ